MKRPLSSTHGPGPSSSNATWVQAKEQAVKRLDTVTRQLKHAASTYKTQFQRAVGQLELERKLRDMGGRINQATGYEDIEKLRLTVVNKEKRLLEAREQASEAKRAYSAAVSTRADSQKEVNDLLQRKSTWTSADSILERYHEEQVWSDKIRSMSTYGSLVITGLNVLLFAVTILLVEPWKRRRLVEGVEERTTEGQDATMASLVTLQSLLMDAQTKLDSLVTQEAEIARQSKIDNEFSTIHPPAYITEVTEDDTEAVESAVAEAQLILANDDKRREQELWVVGTAGVAIDTTDIESQSRPSRTLTISDNDSPGDDAKDAEDTASDKTTVDDAATKVQQQRSKWTIFDPLSRHPAPPPPTSFDDAPEIALARASIISQLLFWWLQPLLVLGYKRDLSEFDLPKMDPSREATLLADKLEHNFERRKREVESWNQALADGTYKPTRWQRFHWRWRHSLGLGSADGQRQVTLTWALSDTFGWSFWSAGLFKIVGDVAQVTSPLIVRELIHFVQRSYYAQRGIEGYVMPSLGKGVGWAFALLCLQLVYSICTAQTFSRGGACGILARAALIAAVYRRSMVMSGKSRVTITNSKLVSHISTDISRIEFCGQFFHFSYSAMLQLLLVIIILLTQIGVSALAGVALVCVALPFQTLAMSKMYKMRQASMKFTDRRIKTISELLAGIKVIKMFAWELPYMDKVHQLRKQELVGIRWLLVIRALTQAIAMSIPTLAAVVVFATYSATGNKQTPAEIWTSLSLLNLLRMPLMLLPNSLSAITDAHSALQRLLPVFLSEKLPDTFKIDPECKLAIHATDCDFTWETSASPSVEPDSKRSKSAKKVASKVNDEKVAVNDTAPSKLSGINLAVPRGQLLCVVGSVGSGKSSLLQGLIGEMRKTKGEVVFGGSIGYCAQMPWSQNTTIRENIIFGQAFAEERYWNCVRAACLLADFDMLPNGDLTQIGEKGITLSGGQRQRVQIARTLYHNADIILLDDPLSAVDAHVGAHLVTNVIQGELKHKTRILVTHALHVLPLADWIVVMDNGVIAEQGTYDQLMKDDSHFAKLAREFGTGDKKDDETEGGDSVTADGTKTDRAESDGQGKGKKTAAKALMQVEERVLGRVQKSTYLGFLKAANGLVTGPLLLLTMSMMCAALILSNFSLVWWQREQWNKSEAFYSGLYAGLGIAQATAVFAMGAAAVLLGSTASITLHRGAVERIIRAPMSFFDTTPLGRVLNRLSKDIDNCDSRLNDSLRMALATSAQIFGSFIIIAIVSRYFLIAVAICLVLYWRLSAFYRASARAIKRHDNVLRSEVYSWFSESLAGLSTIRACQESSRFVSGLQDRVDRENRALLLTVYNQRWLAVRLDLMGALLTITVSAIAVGQRRTLSPSVIGLALSTILAIQQALSMMIRQSTEVENNMASAERLLFYQHQLEQERPAFIESSAPPSTWPLHGSIEFDKVVMSYRPGLPAVLRGLSMSVTGGSKIGVVGRTGAGKSSIMMALFRIVELSSGKIRIDGIDISEIGLTQLREKLAIIPQDALLFNGTIRSNLDPFSVYEDKILWDALRRAWLVEREAGSYGNEVGRNKFSLDSAIEDEGSNLSVGERSLVSLARALVKDSKIVVLDEATASVDAETDARIQATIVNEFKDKTLLVIAHRIRTIIGYDKVLVMAHGQVEAFDTPLDLFDQQETFHSLCVQSGISRDDIVASRRAQA
ncbi:hypothetical protein OIO90_003176 [Microbotryomycetes sp. JL221]|nr:hypothetical protein OIO90_003176 [Microbotryomycetes sp. JL221]